jgi:hypothetical protein
MRTESATESPVFRSTVWDLSGPNIVRSALYTSVMAKVVYIKVSGTETPIRTEADKVEKRDVPRTTTGQYLLILKKNEQEVGEFDGAIVQGWWIQND